MSTVMKLAIITGHVHAGGPVAVPILTSSAPCSTAASGSNLDGMADMVGTYRKRKYRSRHPCLMTLGIAQVRPRDGVYLASDGARLAPLRSSLVLAS